MPRLSARAVIRARPTRKFVQFLRHAWKPFPTHEQGLWGVAAAKYLRHMANLRPDAYARLSDLNVSRVVPRAAPEKILEWVRNDHLHRFEVVNELERVEGKEGWHQMWYIRANRVHSVPGVDITTSRVRHESQIRSLVFATTPDNWPLIEKHNGITPSIPNLHTPRINNRNFTYFAQHLTTVLPQFFSAYPAHNNTPDGKHLVQLHISINVKEAMDLGIKFFKTKRGQILTTGLAKDRRIPMDVFNSVFVVALEREMLLSRVKGQKPEGEGKGGNTQAKVKAKAKTTVVTAS